MDLDEWRRASVVTLHHELHAMFACSYTHTNLDCSQHSFFSNCHFFLVDFDADCRPLFFAADECERCRTRKKRDVRSFALLRNKT